MRRIRLLRVGVFCGLLQDSELHAQGLVTLYWVSLSGLTVSHPREHRIVAF